MQHQRIPGLAFLAFAGLLVNAAACGDDDTTTSNEAYCGRICTKTVELDCPSDTPAAKCDDECATLFNGGPEKCDDQREELLKCASRAEFTCDADGYSYADSCDAKYKAYARCIGADGSGTGDAGSTTTPDAGRPDAGGTVRDAGTDAGRDAGTTGPNFVRLCADYCGPAVATGCTGEGTLADCNANCVANTTGLPECASESADLLTCLSTATLACNTDNNAATNDCDPEFSALDTCQTGGSTSQCTPESTDSCDVCIANLCCAEYTACDDACTNYLDCNYACAQGDTQCVATCGSSYQSQAVNAAETLVNCALTTCSATCS